MGRPTKPIDLATGARTKEEIENRKKHEARLKGSGTIKPPKELSKEQTKIFKNIIDMLKDADVLSCLDVYILTETAVTIDNLNTINNMVREDGSLLYKSSLMTTRSKCRQEFFRCCNELGLSPQARAKMAASFAKKDEEDELMSIMNGSDEDD